MWQSLEPDLTRRPRDGNYFSRALQDRELRRIPDIYRFMFLRSRQAENAIHFVAHVAETSRLAAIAINGQIFAAQRLPHKVWDHPPIVDLHPRSIGIKDAQNARVHLV